MSKPMTLPHAGDPGRDAPLPEDLGRAWLATYARVDGECHWCVDQDASCPTVQIEALVNECADLRSRLIARDQEIEKLTGMLPIKTGPNAQLDQTDADNYYLATENHELKQRLKASQTDLAAAQETIWRTEEECARLRGQRDGFRGQAGELAADANKAEADLATLRAALRALIQQWRTQSHAASKFAEWHPHAAQDLKDSANGQWYAFDECAVKLDACLAAHGGSEAP